MELKPNACHCGHRLTGQIILCWSKTTGDDDKVAPCDGGFQHRNVVVQIVTDRGVEGDWNAQLGKFHTQPLAVRVEILAAREFTTDRDDLGAVHTTAMGRYLCHAPESQLVCFVFVRQFRHETATMAYSVNGLTMPVGPIVVCGCLVVQLA